MQGGISLRICRTTLVLKHAEADSFQTLFKELAASLLGNLSCNYKPANRDTNFENLTSLS